MILLTDDWFDMTFACKGDEELEEHTILIEGDTTTGGFRLGDTVTLTTKTHTDPYRLSMGDKHKEVTIEWTTADDRYSKLTFGVVPYRTEVIDCHKLTITRGEIHPSVVDEIVISADGENGRLDLDIPSLSFKLVLSKPE